MNGTTDVMVVLMFIQLTDLIRTSVNVYTID